MSGTSQPRAARQVDLPGPAGWASGWLAARISCTRAVATIPPVVVQALAADPESPLGAGRSQAVKEDRGAVVVRTWLGPRLEIAYKLWRPKDRFRALLAALRTSPAGRAWRMAHHLRGHGVNTPRPLFFCRRWRAGRSYLATEWLAETADLHRFGWEIDGLHPRERSKLVRTCAARLGEQIGRLHAARVSHRDLKASNLLLARCGEAIEAWLVDLEGARRAARLSPQRRARDLARLALTTAFFPWLTHADRLRFLRAYLHQQRAANDDWKPLWRATSSALKTLIRRQSRRSQPLD